MPTLDALLADRRTLQSRIKRINTAINKHTDKSSLLGPNTLQCHLEDLIKTTEESVELEKKVSACVSDEDWAVHDEVFSNMNEKLVSMKGFLKSLGIGAPPTQQLVAANVPLPRARVKLPQLELPTFSGSYSEWSSFKDLFRSIIDDNASLTAAQKMQYLKSSLKNESAGLIQSMRVTEENYEEAWRIITARYENKREIVYSHMKKLFAQSFIQQESATKIKALVDTTNECVRSLKVLGVPVNEWDTVLVYLCSERLDPESRRHWALSLTGTELPTYKAFQEFTEKHIRGLMAAEVSKPKAKSSKQSQSNDTSKSTYTTSQGTIRKSNCDICSEQHPVFKCEVFRAADVPSRIELVKKHKLCFNCLGNGHSIKQCKSEFTCRPCKRRHHSLLHLQVKTEESAATTNIENPVSCLHVNNGNTTYQVLMSTALVKVRDITGTLQLCRVLIDSAADASFISEKCIQRLGLKRQHVTGTVYGMGATMAPNFNGKCEVMVHSCVNKNSIQVELFVMPKLTRLVPRELCNKTKWEHIKNLTLADPSYYEPANIDIILGDDVFSEVMTGGKVPGPIGTPSAFNSIFGWVLIGKTARSEILSVTVHHAECKTSMTTSQHNITNETSVSEPNAISVNVHYSNTDTLLQKFWEIEHLPERKLLTPEEQLCEEFFTSNHEREVSGRFSVKLPFKCYSPNLGVSRDNAVRRFQQVERRLINKPEQREQYRAFMQEFLTLNHMELIPSGEAKT